MSKDKNLISYNQIIVINNGAKIRGHKNQSEWFRKTKKKIVFTGHSIIFVLKIPPRLKTICCCIL